MAMLNFLGSFVGTSVSRGDQGNPEKNETLMRNDTLSKGQKRTFGWVLGSTIVGILFGTGWIFLYAYQGKDWTQTWSIFAMAAMLAGAFFVSGCLLGFLFGIPHKETERPAGAASQVESGKGQGAGPVPQPASGEVHTNLEQISDWLTKIVVGVGLTQIGSLPEKLKEFAKFASEQMGKFDCTKPSCLPGSEVFAIGILIYYTVCGFLCGFLLTRLFLGKAIREADVAAKFEEVESKLSEAEKRKKADDGALRLVRLQLYAGPGTTLPMQEELNSRIKEASSEAKGQIFYEAQNIRSVNWKDNKPRMERTIPIFRALIASDTEDAYHTNHGQLGFALRDKVPPDHEGAIRELTKAIEIRDKKKEKGWLNYEFVRAICRINLAAKPPTAEEKKSILEDLKAAAQDKDVLGRMKEIQEPSINDWLAANNMQWSDVQAS